MTSRLWSETSKQYEVPYLDRWVQFGNTLIGKLYNADNRFEKGTVVQSDALRCAIDLINLEAETLTEKIKLGQPGTHAEYGLNPDGTRLCKKEMEITSTQTAGLFGVSTS